jgi:hypothetical protein
MPLPTRALLLLLAATACGLSVDEPVAADPGGTAVSLSKESVAGVALSVQVTPTTAAPGDTVLLAAVATNMTQLRIQIGIQCGPPMDVVVTTPGGARRSALVDLTQGGYFTCELSSQHFVEPSGTRAVSIRWVVPAARGDYVASAGLRRSDGLSNMSAPVHLQVR